LAADLLREPNATVGAVARQVGDRSAVPLSSADVLSTAAKRVRGVSPTQHRASASTLQESTQESTMTSADLLVDAFGRIRDVVHQVVDGLTPEQLAFRVDRRSNSIAWLVWHLTRIQDDHVADAAHLAQVWSSRGWAARFGLPFHPLATGYGHTPDEVAAMQVMSGALLVGYYDQVHKQTIRYVEHLTDAELDRIVDEAWDPPVSLGVRLVSVIADDLQHGGQAAFVRGLMARR
jgi:hypothetical protein